MFHKVTEVKCKLQKLVQSNYKRILLFFQFNIVFSQIFVLGWIVYDLQAFSFSNVPRFIVQLLKTCGCLQGRIFKNMFSAFSDLIFHVKIRAGTFLAASQLLAFSTVHFLVLFQGPCVCLQKPHSSSAFLFLTELQRHWGASGRTRSAFRPVLDSESRGNSLPHQDEVVLMADWPL